MADKKLTPMMELIEWVNQNKCNEENQAGDKLIVVDADELEQKANELLEKERQMVVDAYEDGIDGVDYCENRGWLRTKIGEQYYNETFKTK